MRHFLLPEGGRFHKACLHTHTRISDGIHTPEEIKRKYLECGYSVVAFTDHDVMIPHNDLTDDRFLALTSFEMYTDRPGDLPWGTATYHLNLYAKNPEQTVYPCPNPSYASAGNAAQHAAEQAFYQGDYVRRYGPEGQNEIIAEANAHGFLVCYNHPDWSLQRYPDYAGLDGLWAVEVFNTGCVVEGFHLDGADHVLDDLLSLGKRVLPVATDDCHADYDCFGGWVCLKAPALTYGDVMNALEKGDFYASWGPAITSLSLCDGILSVDCSTVSEIVLRTGVRYAERRAGDSLTHADFDLRTYLSEMGKAGANGRAYVRLVLRDADGNRAVTRGYFLDEFPPECLA